MSKKGECGSAMAVQKTKKRNSSSPLRVAAKGSSPSTQDHIKVQHHHPMKKREVGGKRKRSSEAVGGSSSLKNEQDRKKKKKMMMEFKKMKAQMELLKASVVEKLRTQTDFNRRLLLEAEAILAEQREENKRLLSQNSSDQHLADHIQSYIFSFP